MDIQKILKKVNPDTGPQLVSEEEAMQDMKNMRNMQSEQEEQSFGSANTDSYFEKYRDPENLEEIKEKIKLCTNLAQVVPLVKEVFPEWIVGEVKGYSEDYYVLTNNWDKTCKQVKTTRQCILIIDDEQFSHETHRLSGLFCEMFTRCGFSVRYAGHIIPCTVCRRAIPTKEIYNLMVENGTRVPKVWSRFCKSCKEETYGSKQ